MEPLVNVEKTIMRAITVKNIPDALYEQLKRAAESHHRSINSELIVTLEKVLIPRQIDKDDFLANARRLRGRIQMDAVTEEELREIKDEGRP
jgi:plasmid stability protein